MVECDVSVPEELQDYFSEMQPVFKNASVTRDDIGPFMRQYAEEHSQNHASRLGSFRGVKILLATPLLRRYLAHGLVVDRVYQIIEYEPNTCFRRFGESVSAARRGGDEDPDRAIIADTIKLLSNSGYGKTETNVDQHRDIKYCTEIDTSALINNKRFRQLGVVTDDAYEIKMNKNVVKYTLPLHIGFFVYQYAKLRMLQFYYDFVDRCFSIARWTQIRHTLRWLVKASMDSSGQIVVRTTSDTDSNGYRPNVATNTKTTMSALE